MTFKDTVIAFSLTLLISGTACTAQEENEMTLTEQTSHKHTNQLINETSPYLLQHAHNPVNWYPWGEEALAKAKTDDKPIFLSIGYASCHWCHVMERESFEDEAIAALLNEYFVCIKVDREQRPDIDQIYMSFTTALTGSGGWPMSVFLTPDRKPFFAGTYFPPEDRYGRPGFAKVVSEIGRAWSEEREAIFESADDIFDKVSARLEATAAPTMLTADLIKRTFETLANTVDRTHGGFGQAPKFPHGAELSGFLRYYRFTGDLTWLNDAEQALIAMARGGIYDHLGGGFARYSTDREWLVPHFEKMLYDNALLVPTYVEAYQTTSNDLYLDVVRGTLDWILGEMTDQSDGFYSAIDADSEGEEGKFYVWTKAEIDRILGEKSEIFCRYYNVSDGGNFEGKNILHLTTESDRIKQTADDGFDRLVADGKNKLLEARAERVRPLTDDKILASWNGLALTAFCKGYQATGDRRYLAAAIKNAAFINEQLYRDGRLTHAFRDGRHSEGQFLEDYSFLIRGLLDLYETDLSDDNLRWLEFADQLAGSAMQLFADADGHFYLRPDGQEDLIVRPKNETDGAIPSAGSLMITNLLRLNRLTGKAEYLAAAEKALRAISGQITQYPSAMMSAVMALDYYLNDKIEIVVVGRGDERDRMLEHLWASYLPNRIIAVSDNGRNQLPLFEGRATNDGDVKAYVCRNSVCQLPATTVAELRDHLSRI